MSADPRTDPRTPDPLADALRIALDRLDAYIEGTDDESIIDGDTDEDREFIREARSALAALPSAPDQRLREALVEWEAIDGTSLVDQFRAFIAAGKMADAIRAALSEATTSPEPTLDVERLCNLVVQAFTEFATEGERARQAGWSFLSDAYAIARTHPTLAARLRGPA